MINSSDINNNIKILNKNRVNSCMTVWKAQDDHPLRAMVVNENGY